MEEQGLVRSYMRCLHCGRRLPILRKLTSAEFCSDEHGREYGRRQEELALSRLIEQQTVRRIPRARRPKDLSRLLALLGDFAALEPRARGWGTFQKTQGKPLASELSVVLPLREVTRIKRRLPTASISALAASGYVKGPQLSHPPVEAQWTPATLADFRFTPFRPLWTLPPGRAMAPVFQFHPVSILREAAGLLTVVGAPGWGRFPMVPITVLPVELPMAAAVETAGVQSLSIRSRHKEEPAAPIWGATQPSWAWLEELCGFTLRTELLLPADSDGIEFGPRPGGFLRTVPSPGLSSNLEQRLDGPASKLAAQRRPPSLPGFRYAGTPAWRGSPQTMPAASYPAPSNSPLRAAAAAGSGWGYLEPPSLSPLTPEPTVAMQPALRLAPALLEPATGNRRPCLTSEAAAFTVRRLLPATNRPIGTAQLKGGARIAIRVPLADVSRPVECSPPAPDSLPPAPAARWSRLTTLPDFFPPITGFVSWPATERSLAAEFQQRNPTPNTEAAAELTIHRPRFELTAKAVCEPGYGGWLPMDPAKMDSSCHAKDSGAELMPPAGVDASTGLEMVDARIASMAGRTQIQTPLIRLTADQMAPADSCSAPIAVDELAWPSMLPLLPKSLCVVGRDMSKSDSGFAGWRSPVLAASTLWQRLPSGARWSSAFMSLLLTMTLGWVYWGSAPATRVGEKQASVSVMSNTWQSLQDGILRRAAVSLTDDFRLGLSEWEGEGEWANQWSYDTAGFVRTGSMAMYTPSRPLTDYRMEFLGQIERKSMSWTVRSADSKNYYAVKIVLTNPGPLPTATIVRYPVIDGKPGRVVETPVRLPIRMDTLYRVSMDIHGNDYTLALQGQVVDTWSESRLTRGGVGFFSGKGELARIRWVGVWHQYDMLGRLCALLAPTGLQPRERNSE